VAARDAPDEVFDMTNAKTLMAVLMVLTFVGIAGAVTDTEKFSGQSGPYKMSFTYGNASKYSNVSIFREGRSTEDYTYDPLVGWDKTGGYGMAVVFNDSHTVEVILSVIPRSSRMELSDKEFRDKTWVVSYSKLAEARNEPYKVWTLNNLNSVALTPHQNLFVC
jgi:hypothetical protein